MKDTRTASCPRRRSDAMADRIDPEGSHGLAANLWFQACARGTHPRNGHSGQRAACRRFDESCPDYRTSRADEVKWLHGVATADDLVHRRFHRLSPNELWVTKITEHPARKGKVFCCAVMDTFSRNIVGWPIDNAEGSALVSNALDTAIKNRQPAAGGIIYADHRVQFTSWASTKMIRASGLMPSLGTIGDCFDNSMMESFWSSLQIEPLNRKKWRTRLDLANAIFDYIEMFYNRQCCRSKLAYSTPNKQELRFNPTSSPSDPHAA